MSNSLKEKLEQIDQLKAEIAAMPAMSDKSRDDLWRKYRLEWNYNSNHIEGNTLTLGETKLLLIFDQVSGDHTIREIDEMRGHDAAIKLVSDWAKDKERLISESDIRSLNEILLVRPFYSDAITPSGQKAQKLITPGEYKNQPNHVKLQSGETFRYAEPEEVESKMHDLIANYRKDMNDVHPVIMAAKLHYEFVLIHPFDDGNGRVSRLLMNYHLLRNDLAPIIIKSADKKNYLLALNKADSGDFSAFAEYIATEEIWSLELMLKATKGKDIEEDEDWKKELQILSKHEIKAKKTKNSALVGELLKDSIIPLYESIFAVLQEFNTVVFSNDCVLHITNLAGGGIKFNSPNEIFSRKWEETEWAGGNIYFNLVGFDDNSADGRTISKSIYIDFKLYGYQIEFIGKNLSRSYSVNLKVSEISEISNHVGSYLINEIKKPNN